HLSRPATGRLEARGVILLGESGERPGPRGSRRLARTRMSLLPAGGPPRSRLEGVLRAGHFAVTAEMQASNGADPEEIRRLALALRGSVDAANCTDNPAARPHLSSLAAGAL